MATKNDRITWEEIRLKLTEYLRKPVNKRYDGVIEWGGDSKAKDNLDLILSSAVKGGKLNKEAISFFTLVTGQELVVTPTTTESKRIDLSHYVELSSIQPKKIANKEIPCSTSKNETSPPS